MADRWHSDEHMDALHGLGLRLQLEPEPTFWARWKPWLHWLVQMGLAFYCGVQWGMVK